MARAIRAASPRANTVQDSQDETNRLEDEPLVGFRRRAIWKGGGCMWRSITSILARICMSFFSVI